jgi:hypothetical protein
MGLLEEVWQWYECARDSIEATVHQIKTDLGAIPPSLVFARHVSPGEALRNLGKAKEELDDLTVLALFAVFEQELLQHLLLTSEDVRSRVPARLQECLLTRAFRGIERWPLDEVLDVYKATIDQDLVGLVKQVKDYRDWVAHGKKGPPDASIDPSNAYERLTRFLGGLTWVASDGSQSVSSPAVK